MSPLSLRAALLALALCGCRDEQAGPRGRQAPLPAPARPKQLEAVPAELTFRSGATLGGGAVRYHGSRVARRGTDVEVSHYFEALGPPPQGYGLFVHVVDAASGRMLFNADHAIQGGALPLERWTPGAIVEDTHLIPNIPAEARLRLLLGFWRGEERLPVDSSEAHDGSHRLLGPFIGQPPPELPTYTAPRVSRPPAIDGRLDDEAWRNAPAVTLLRSLDGAPTVERTVAKLAHDGHHLYVAFDCEDRDIFASLSRRDDPLYTEEVVEIFLDADGDGATYDELEVSPRNVLFDAYFPARRQGMDTSWNPAVTTAVQVRGTIDVTPPDDPDDDEGWTVELKIPLRELHAVPRVPVRAGDRWRFNLYRLDVRRPEGYAFSPLFVGDFHHLPRFGILIFGG